MGKELNKNYYNEVFSNGGNNKIYHKEHSEVVWNAVWTRIGNLIKEEYSEKAKILDIGCGPGQFAESLLKFKPEQYLGIDFSDVAITLAKQRLQGNNNFSFLNESVLECDFENLSFDYNVVVTTEFLEHVNDDLGIIKKIKTNTKIYATFPDEDADGHVRFYSSNYKTACEQIKNRYEDLCEILSIEEWPYFNNTKRDYLAIMVKK